MCRSRDGGGAVEERELGVDVVVGEFRCGRIAKLPEGGGEWISFPQMIAVG